MVLLVRKKYLTKVKRLNDAFQFFKKHLLKNISQRKLKERHFPKNTGYRVYWIFWCPKLCRELKMLSGVDSGIFVQENKNNN